MATRGVASHHVLFEAGQPRTHLYRLISGAVCSFRQDPDGRREVVEFAVTGDVVGFGGFDHYLWSAEAVSDTQVACLPVSSQDEIVARDPAARARLARTIESELVIRRNVLREAGAKSPLVRVASYLVAVSAINAREGRHAEFISDDLKCGAVADQLGFEIDELACQLTELAGRSLLAVCPTHGLRLLDIPALQRLADGH